MARAENICARVGEKVRQFRLKSGMSQVVVSERCGIFRTYLSRIENGMANPTITVLAALATVLGTKIGSFFDE